jgi:hypothetical protein
MVSVTGHKKHNVNHPSQVVNIEQTEKGLVAIPEDKYAFHKKRVPVNAHSGSTPLISEI